MSGWGVAPWGVSGWGGVTSPIAFSYAFALTTRDVGVVLTGDALAESVIGDGDALNPATWSVYEVDSSGTTTRSLTVIAVTPRVSNSQFVVRTLEPFSRYPNVHVVASSTLRDALGVVLDLPRSAEFTGVIAAVSETARIMPADLLNAPANNTTLAGALVVGSDGDYNNQRGADLLRKLVTRRLTTTRGGFFYLPNYGIGLKLKEPVPLSSLRLLKNDIANEIAKEPDITNVRVAASLSRDGVLTINVTATFVATGDDVSTELELS